MFPGSSADVAEEAQGRLSFAGSGWVAGAIGVLYISVIARAASGSLQLADALATLSPDAGFGCFRTIPGTDGVCERLIGTSKQ